MQIRQKDVPNVRKGFSLTMDRVLPTVIWDHLAIGKHYVVTTVWKAAGNANRNNTAINVIRVMKQFTSN